jgi:hypothetical protein
MPAIRVLLGDMTPMFGSLVSGVFAGQAGVELVAPEQGQSYLDCLGEQRGTQRFDVVLLRIPDLIDANGVLTTFAHSAPLGVVAIGDNGESGIAFRIERQSVPLTSTGDLDLVGAMRLAAGRA